MIKFTDPSADAEELDREVSYLLHEMKDSSDIETVNRITDPNPPDLGKGAGFLLGILKAEVSFTNAKALFGFLVERLGNKVIELEVEANGRKLKVKASSREELELAIQEAQRFISA